MIMVKPALPYLDIIQRVRERFECRGDYNVSGRVCDGGMRRARKGWIDEQRVVIEIMTSFRGLERRFVLTHHGQGCGAVVEAC